MRSDSWLTPVLVCIIVIGVGLAGLFALFTRHAKRGTTFAPGYSHKVFSRVKCGMSKGEVLGLLGEPLERGEITWLDQAGRPGPTEEVWYYSLRTPGARWWFTCEVHFDRATGRVVRQWQDPAEYKSESVRSKLVCSPPYGAAGVTALASGKPDDT